MPSSPENKTHKNLRPWKVIREHDEISGRWLRVRNVDFLLPNGEELKEYYIAERPAVVVVIPFKQGQTFLIQEFERGVNEVGHKFPAGNVDEDEEPSEAALRELREEMGLQPNNLIFLGETYVEPGFMTNRAHYFLALEPQDIPKRKEDEPFELFVGEWVNFSEIGPMIAENKIKNPFVVVGYVLTLGYLQKAGLV